MFVVGTEADHIAPWRSVYKARLFTDCDLTFVLASAGHNGGILSEPGHARRHYRVGRRKFGDLYVDPDSWLARHDPVDGSWWPEMVTWLKRGSSEVAPATKLLAKKNRRSLGKAPGEYVFQD